MRAWSTADCSKLVSHVIKDTNEWVWKDNVMKGTVDALQVPEVQDFVAAVYNAVVEGDGVMLQESLDIAAKNSDYMVRGRMRTGMRWFSRSCSQ